MVHQKLRAKSNSNRQGKLQSKTLLLDCLAGILEEVQEYSDSSLDQGRYDPGSGIPDVHAVWQSQGRRQ
jgi:hypothetical protein